MPSHQQVTAALRAAGFSASRIVGRQRTEGFCVRTEGFCVRQHPEFIGTVAVMADFYDDPYKTAEEMKQAMETAGFKTQWQFDDDENTGVFFVI